MSWKCMRAWGECNLIHGFYLVPGVYLFSKDMMKDSEEDNTLQSVMMSRQNGCALNVSCKRSAFFVLDKPNRRVGEYCFLVRTITIWAFGDIALTCLASGDRTRTWFVAAHLRFRGDVKPGLCCLIFGLVVLSQAKIAQKNRLVRILVLLGWTKVLSVSDFFFDWNLKVGAARWCIG